MFPIVSATVVNAAARFNSGVRRLTGKRPKKSASESIAKKAKLEMVRMGDFSRVG
jgi:hypothetical protein